MIECMLLELIILNDCRLFCINTYVSPQPKEMFRFRHRHHHRIATSHRHNRCYCINKNSSETPNQRERYETVNFALTGHRRNSSQSHRNKNVLG